MELRPWAEAAGPRPTWTLPRDFMRDGAPRPARALQSTVWRTLPALWGRRDWLHPGRRPSRNRGRPVAQTPLDAVITCMIQNPLPCGVGDRADPGFRVNPWRGSPAWCRHPRVTPRQKCGSWGTVTFPYSHESSVVLPHFLCCRGPPGRASRMGEILSSRTAGQAAPASGAGVGSSRRAAAGTTAPAHGPQGHLPVCS